MTIKRVIIADVETTGLSPENDLVIEVAGVLFDVEHIEVVASYSALQHAPKNDAEHVNQISARLLRSLPVPFLHVTRPDGAVSAIGDAAFEPMYGFLPHADAFVAHRATFDRSFFPKALARMLPWICSKFSCEWPVGRYGDHLTNLAIAHHVPVTGAHRALDDCMLIAEVLKAAHLRLATSSVSSDDGAPVWDLTMLLERGLARGVGEPSRCEHGLNRVEKAASGEEFARPSQCPNYVRSFLRQSPTLRRLCPDHGGSAQWVS